MSGLPLVKLFNFFLIFLIFFNNYFFELTIIQTISFDSIFENVINLPALIEIKPCLCKIYENALDSKKTKNLFCQKIKTNLAFTNEQIK
jgi:hypothetical protein